MTWLALILLLALGACSAEPGENPATPPSEPVSPTQPVEPGSPTEPARCDIPECFRPVECVEECGGPVLSSSCCPCPEGQLDRLVDCPAPAAPADETGTSEPSEDSPTL